MRIALSEHFQRDVRRLRADQRAVTSEAMLALPLALGNPHRHGALGMRQIHPSGIWETRVGLGLRLVFTVQPGVCTLIRLGAHDEIRRFLREL